MHHIKEADVLGGGFRFEAAQNDQVVFVGDLRELRVDFGADELEDAVGGACMQARVVLGYINSTLRVVESMQAGDILYFKKPDHAVLEANEIPAFDVNVGTLGAQVAVQIERAVVPGKS